MLKKKKNTRLSNATIFLIEPSSSKLTHHYLSLWMSSPPLNKKAHIELLPDASPASIWILNLFGLPKKTKKKKKHHSWLALDPAFCQVFPLLLFSQEREKKGKWNAWWKPDNVVISRVGYRARRKKTKESRHTRVWLRLRWFPTT